MCSFRALMRSDDLMITMELREALKNTKRRLERSVSHLGQCSSMNSLQMKTLQAMIKQNLEPVKFALQVASEIEFYKNAFSS